GIRSVPLAPGEQVGGTVVAGATCLSGQTLDGAENYRWLWADQPQAILDHTLWVFDTVPKLQ
ncbi:MAG: hypothetical protein WAK23_19600, partial [Terriglobales bacterium]